MATWSDVRRIVKRLPETEEGTSYGNTAWTVRGKGFVWERPLRRADLEALGTAAPEGPIIAAHVESLDAKEAVIASDPAVFFTTPHFNGYKAVLARLDRMPVGLLEELIEEAWLARAPKKLRTSFEASRTASGGRRRARGTR